MKKEKLIQELDKLLPTLYVIAQKVDELIKEVSNQEGKTPTETSVPRDIGLDRVTDSMLDALEHTDDCALNSWEEEFVSSILKQAESGRTLSEKQRASVEKILIKYKIEF